MKTGGAFLTSEICSEEIVTRERFSEEQQEIGKTVEEFARQRIRPNKHEIEKFNKELSLDLLRECGELGLLSIDIPEEHGGLGLDKVTSAIVAEKISSGLCSSFAATFGAHTGIGTLPIVFFGSEAQKQKYLPKLATAEWLGSYALTEPEAGSDAISAKTIAKLSEDGRHYILNGTKQFITNAQWAQVYTTFANVDGDKFTGFIIERDTPGLSIGPEEKKMGVKGSSTCSVYLENAKVPVENVLGEIGSGAAIAFNTLNIGRFKLAAATLGSCKVVIGEALQYATQRKQFGQAIRNFDVIKGYFADMVIRTYALDCIVYRTIGLIDQAIAEIPDSTPDYNKSVAEAIERYAIEASMCKVFGSEGLSCVADMGVQIHGGYGFIEEYPLASVLRDNRIDRIWEGTNEINRQIIVGYFLKRALLEELPIRESIREIDIEKLSSFANASTSDSLASEKRAFEIARTLVLYTFNETINKFGQDLQSQQQIGSLLSDMFVDVYVMSSAIARVHQQIDKKEFDPIWLPLVQVLCAEKTEAILVSAQKILNAVVENPYLGKCRLDLNIFREEMQLSANVFELKREIAEDLYEKG